MATEILALDEISSSQAQKETTHNTALRQIEGRMIRAKDKDLTTPPGSPANGDTYIIPSGATGVWSGKTNQLAHFYGGAWVYWVPIEGVRLWLNDEDTEYAFDGASWVLAAALSLYPVVALTANYTVTAADRGKLFKVDTAAGNITLTLPAVATAKDNFAIVVVKTSSDGNAVVIDPAGAETINGGSTLSITTQWSSAQVVCDGTAWYGLTGGGGGAALPVSDATEIVRGSADATKKLRFEVDGFTAGTTRVATWPDKDGTVAMTADVPQGAAARVYNSAAQSVASGGSGTVLTFDSERYDTDNFHSTATNTGRLTAPLAGRYHIGGMVEFAGSATGERRIDILLNGTTVIARASEQGVGAGAVTLTVGCEYSLNATDYVELRAYQDSGAALNVQASGDYSPEFSIHNIAGGRLTPFRGALVKKSAAQAITSANTWTNITWDQEEYDTSGFHDNSTNNSRLTVPSGVSRVRLLFGFTTDAGSVFNAACQIIKNGANFQGNPGAQGDSGFTSAGLVLASPVLSVTPGDYFEAQVFFSVNTRSVSSSTRSWFSIEVVE